MTALLEYYTVYMYVQYNIYVIVVSCTWVIYLICNTFTPWIKAWLAWATFGQRSCLCLIWLWDWLIRTWLIWTTYSWPWKPPRSIAFYCPRYPTCWKMFISCITIQLICAMQANSLGAINHIPIWYRSLNSLYRPTCEFQLWNGKNYSVSVLWKIPNCLWTNYSTSSHLIS